MSESISFSEASESVSGNEAKSDSRASASGSDSGSEESGFHDSGSGSTSSIAASSSSDDDEPMWDAVPWKKADWLSEKEKGIVGFLCYCRKYPTKFANDIMKPMKGSHFTKAGEVWKPDYDIDNRYMPIGTREHLAGFEKAIEYVKQQPEMQPLRVSKHLSLAAQDHVADQSQTGERGHIGDDGSVYRDRIERYGTAEEPFAELLSYGQDEAKENVVWLIFNDGNQAKVDRNAIFNPAFNVCGVAAGGHSAWGASCVILLAAGAKDDNEKIAAREEIRSVNYQTARDAEYITRTAAGGCCALL